MIPVSRALTLLAPAKPRGIIRDSYNHLVAITLPGNAEGTREVVVPVADDGVTFYKDLEIRIHISWNSVMKSLATAEE